MNEKHYNPPEERALYMFVFEDYLRLQQPALLAFHAAELDPLDLPLGHMLYQQTA